MTTNTTTEPPRISIAIRAWNEEAVIRRTLKSLFEQSLFDELSARGEWCEVLCISMHFWPKASRENIRNLNPGGALSRTLEAS